MKDHPFLHLPALPGLDLLEGLQLRHRHKDDDGLLAPAAVDLLGGGDVELPQLGLQVGVDLEVQQGLADPLLNLVRLLIVGLDNLTTGYSGHNDTSETGDCCDKCRTRIQLHCSRKSVEIDKKF